MLTGPVRVMVFYDGAFFKKGQLYYRYSENRGWVSLSNFHDILETYVANKTKTPAESVKVVGAHYYDGRLTTNVATSDQLEKERDFEMSLIEAGIVPHYLPVRETPKDANNPDAGYSIVQKGVDVKIAIDVLDAAHTNRFDVCVIVAGDADFVPLIQAVTSINKQVLVAYFEIPAWKDSNGTSHRPTYTSQALLQRASFTFGFHSFIKDPDYKMQAQNLFFQTKSQVAAKYNTPKRA